MNQKIHVLHVHVYGCVRICVYKCNVPHPSLCGEVMWCAGRQVVQSREPERE